MRSSASSRSTRRSAADGASARPSSIEAAGGDIRNPLRLLMIVPVPWVFVLTYLAGAGLEWARPRAVAPHAARASTIVGAALFLAGAAIAGSRLAIFGKAGTTTVPGESSA